METEPSIQVAIQAVLRHLHAEAEQAQHDLSEVIGYLAEGNALAALGAFNEIDERIQYVGLVLRRMNQGQRSPDRPSRRKNKEEQS